MEEKYFNKIRSVCVNLTKNLTAETAADFTNVLKVAENSEFVTDKLFQYILFAVRLALKKCQMDDEINEKTKLLMVEAVNILIDKHDFSKPDDLLSDLVILVNMPGNEKLIGTPELWLSTLSCITKIFEKSKRNIATYDRLRSNECRPILAHCVSCILKILKNQRQTSILSCLSLIVCSSPSTACSFLPGVSSVLSELLVNSKLNDEDFLSSCFETLLLVIKTACEDEKNQTEDWRRNAELQLKSLTERLSVTFVCHFSTKLRLSLLQFAICLYVNEAEIFKDSKKRLLEIICIVATDEKVGDEASNLVERAELLGEQFYEQLQNSLTSVCWRLPRMSKSSVFNVQQKIEWQHFCGCLKLLGPKNGGYFFLNDTQAKLFCRSFCEALEFGNIVWEFDTEVDASAKQLDSSKLTLNQPSDLYAQKLILICFDVLSTNGELDTILDYFYDVFGSISSQFKRQSAFIMNGILFFASKNRLTCSSSLIENLFEDYLTWLDTPEFSSTDIHLALNGIIVCASLLQHNAQSYLVRALYLILAFLDSPATKHQVSWVLQNLANVFHFSSAKILVVNHLDYLTSSLVTRFKQLSLNQTSPRVLCALLDIIGVENLRQMQFAIIECLAAVDRCREDNPPLPVLLNCLEKFGKLCSEIVVTTPSELDVLSEEEDEAQEDFCVVKKKTKLPWHINIIVNNLNSIQSWLGAETFSVRMASVQALRENLRALRFTKDELLPAVHRCWASVLARLRDAETPCKIAAFQVILCMAEISRDFVRFRIENEAYSSLEKFVSSNIGDTRRSGVAYQQSSAFRLQMEICDNLGELCRLIAATPKFIDKCKSILNLYCSEPKVPKILLEASLKSLKILSNLNQNSKLD